MSLNASLIVLVVALGLLVILWFVHITAPPLTATLDQKNHVWLLNSAAFGAYVGGRVKQSDRPNRLGLILKTLLILSTLFSVFYMLVLAH